jgi:hypothetical protein
MDIEITRGELTRLTGGRVQPMPFVRGIRFSCLEDGTVVRVSLVRQLDDGRRYVSSSWTRSGSWPDWADPVGAALLADVRSA